MGTEIAIISPDLQRPLPPVEWNYADAKKDLEAQLQRYKHMVYTPETLTDAKSDRVRLGHVLDGLRANKKDVKDFFLKPFETYDKQVSDLITLVDTVRSEIDRQIKAMEEVQKQEKKQEIMDYYQSVAGDLANLVPYSQIHEKRWLNRSVSLPTIQTELCHKIDVINSGLQTIGSLRLDPSTEEQVKAKFLDGFDINAAIQLKDKILQRRAQLQALQSNSRPTAHPAMGQHVRSRSDACLVDRRPATPTPAEPEAEKDPMKKTYTVQFEITVTGAQLMQLKAAMNQINICPVQIEGGKRHGSI